MPMPRYARFEHDSAPCVAVYYARLDGPLVFRIYENGAIVEAPDRALSRAAVSAARAAL